MSCDLTQGRSRVCKDSVSGIAKLYLFPFVKYTRSQIVRTGLTLTTFPATTIYQFDGVDISFTQNQQFENGSKFYNQNLSVNFIQIREVDEFEKLLNKDYRIIVEDRNGNKRLLGAYTGLTASLNQDTGSSNASFNGTKLTFEAQEIDEALFIGNLSDAGFTIESNNFLLLEDDTFILTEDNQFIIIEE